MITKTVTAYNPMNKFKVQLKHKQLERFISRFIPSFESSYVTVVHEAGLFYICQ